MIVEENQMGTKGMLGINSPGNADQWLQTLVLYL